MNRRTTAMVLVVGILSVVVICSVVATSGLLAPVDIATGQTQSQNQSNESIKFTNQTTNGSAVIIERATLPDGGFIVLSNDPYSEVGVLRESMIAVSEPLSPGTHHNITIQVNNSPPGGYVNQTALNTTSDYSVGLYRDSNNNSRFEYIASFGDTDEEYLTGSGKERRFVSDPALITIPESNTSTPNARVRFVNQSTNGSTVTVDSVTLPDGGFVVVHSESYLQGGDPLQSTIGLSTYLQAGTHQNVTVALTNGSVQQSQTLVAVPSRDTNDNQTYDYVRSDGFQDVPYTAKNKPITDTASVTASNSAVSTTGSPSTPTTTTANTLTPTSTRTRTDTSQPATSEAGNSGDGGNRDDGGGGGLTDNILLVAIGIVFVAGAFLLIKLRS